MGPLRTTAAVAIAAVLMLPHAATAAPVQDFDARIDNKTSSVKAGSKRSPRAHALRITTGTRETTPGVLPPSITRARIYFPRGARYNGRYFRGCSSSSISAARSTDDCSQASIVGDGEATGDATGGITQDDIEISAVNGVNGKYINLFVEGKTPLRIQSNIRATIRSLKSSTYSYRLDVPIPQNLQEPAPGVFVAISNFRVNIDRKTVSRRGDRVGYIESTSCPTNRRWKFKGVFEYRDGSTKTETDTVRCTR